MSTLSRHSAAGQALGYLWQVHLAVLRLAEASSGSVGIETLDDVVYEHRSGHMALTQAKSTIDPSRNPVSDSSSQLWKTLATWTDALIVGEIDPARMRLFLVTNASLPNCLAVRIGAAHDAASASNVVRELRTVPNPPSDTLNPFVTRVRAATDAQLASLVSCIEVQHGGTGHSHQGIREQILAKCHLPDGVDGGQFLDALVGWLHNMAVEQWSNGQLARATQTDFNNVRQRVVESLRRRRIRELPSRAIACDQSALDSHRTRGFVRQLEIIDANEATVDDAITDFIKHNHERLRLVKEGHVLDEDWEAFEARLVEHWKPIHRGQPTAMSKTEMRRIGHTTYNEVQKHREVLAGLRTDEFYLTRGAYQRLADTSALGWHPQYGTLIPRASP